MNYKLQLVIAVMVGFIISETLVTIDGSSEYLSGLCEQDYIYMNENVVVTICILELVLWAHE
jgi:hypothetical protein